MEDSKIIEKISEALLNLEEQGEIVITSTMLPRLSRTIFHSAIEGWIEESGLLDEPIECSIPHLLEQTVSELANGFSIDVERATAIVNAYYNKWTEVRDLKEIAEIFWHETPREMARRAYYHIEMGKEDNRDLEYLAWRKNL